MAAVMLDHIRMKRESKSFTDSLHAVLTAANLFDGPKYRLSGLSGMAFKLSVHRKLLPLSVTAYGQWGDEHRPAVDRLGIFTQADAGRTRHPTFLYFQQAAVRQVKTELDQGRGVIYWIPEFGVIHGYDDDDEVFYIRNGWSDESEIVLYDNFGLNVTPFWYVQTVGGKVDLPMHDQIVESLRAAVLEWNTPYKTLPDREIGSGRLAYTYWLGALDAGDYDEFGAVYILQSYVTAKREIRDYLREAATFLPVIGGIAEQSTRIAGLAEEGAHCIDHCGKSPVIDRKKVAELQKLLRQALSLEEGFIKEIEAFLAGCKGPEKEAVPRWGTCSPR